MPSDIKISVKVKRHAIRWQFWYATAWLFGIGSIPSRAAWWFLEPLELNVADGGWEIVGFDDLKGESNA